MDNTDHTFLSTCLKVSGCVAVAAFSAFSAFTVGKSYLYSRLPKVMIPINTNNIVTRSVFYSLQNTPLDKPVQARFMTFSDPRDNKTYVWVPMPGYMWEMRGDKYDDFSIENHDDRYFIISGESSGIMVEDMVKAFEDEQGE